MAQHAEFSLRKTVVGENAKVTTDMLADMLKQLGGSAKSVADAFGRFDEPSKRLRPLGEKAQVVK